MDNAAWGGHLDILKWLHVNKPEGFSFYTLSEVGKSQLISLKCAHGNSAYIYDILNVAATKGDFRMCRWLLGHHEGPLGLTIALSLESALRKSHLELACYLHELIPVDSIRFGSSFDDMRKLSRMKLNLI
ncbi:unnamed protein product [Phytophthora fragariaefolia]|uniref:Unnamed protein product n=1 Tax=Phytophthora fragariaefolia TaxID=1490495 RepID=A0A9W6YAG3_9STRA|nr:unnamed protein product [Phytophthora fragariaefolia]